MVAALPRLKAAPIPEAAAFTQTSGDDIGNVLSGMETPPTPVPEDPAYEAVPTPKPDPQAPPY
jgi:hypothetical protein